jgi:hypothetical protein
VSTSTSTKGRTSRSKAAVPAARQPIPSGMTRSRGKLIPVSSGQCEARGNGESRCKNPGRWNRDGLTVCSVHNAAKAAVAFDQKAARRAARKAKVVASASA